MVLGGQVPTLQVDDALYSGTRCGPRCPVDGCLGSPQGTGPQRAQGRSFSDWQRRLASSRPLNPLNPAKDESPDPGSWISLSARWLLRLARGRKESLGRFSHISPISSSSSNCPTIPSSPSLALFSIGEPSFSRRKYPLFTTYRTSFGVCHGLPLGTVLHHDTEAQQELAAAFLNQSCCWRRRHHRCPRRIRRSHFDPPCQPRLLPQKRASNSERRITIYDPGNVERPPSPSETTTPPTDHFKITGETT